MKFRDASAIAPLLVAETQTKQLQSIAAKDSAMLMWWGSGVECHSLWHAANATARSIGALWRIRFSGSSNLRTRGTKLIRAMPSEKQR